MFREFGYRIGNPRLEKIVIFLYNTARADSTRKTYAVGQRHWLRFHNLHPSIPFFPFAASCPDTVTLALCFFAGYLASRPSITRYTTVRGYLCHVKALWRDAGCAEKRLNSPLLRKVMRGIRRALPAPPDKRAAFVLPNMNLPGYYFRPPSSRWLLFKAAVVLGFHAMLRYGAFCQLSPNALTLVFNDGRERAFCAGRPDQQDLGPTAICGVLFTFVPKYTLCSGLGTAFFSHICDIAPQWAPHCPVCALAALKAKGALRATSSNPLFPPPIFSPHALSAYLGHLAGKVGLPPDNPFKPHSLRIGGHTYYTVHGMDPDLRDHLARRAITRSSLRYYRASPHSNLHAIRAFYKRTVAKAKPAPPPTNSPPPPS